MYRRTRLLGILVVCLSASSLFLVDGTRPSYAQGSKTVQLTLSITDANTGFNLKAEKQVAQGVNAFDAVRQIVSLRYTTHPTLGPLVTELAGVSPPGGCCWLLYTGWRVVESRDCRNHAPRRHCTRIQVAIDLR